MVPLNLSTFYLYAHCSPFGHTSGYLLYEALHLPVSQSATIALKQLTEATPVKCEHFFVLVHLCFPVPFIIRGDFGYRALAMHSHYFLSFPTWCPLAWSSGMLVSATADASRRWQLDEAV